MVAVDEFFMVAVGESSMWMLVAYLSSSITVFHELLRECNRFFDKNVSWHFRDSFLYRRLLKDYSIVLILYRC